MNKKQRKRAATAGAVVMMLAVLHLSTKDASGTPAQCEVGHSNPPIVGPCPPNYVPPTTVVFEVTPYKPGDPTLPPPVEGVPTPKPLAPGIAPVVALAPATGVVAAQAQGCRDEHYGDGTTEIICDTNGILPGPPLPVKQVPTIKLALPATE